MSQGGNQPSRNRNPGVFKLLRRRINSITQASRRARNQSRQRFVGAQKQLTGRIPAIPIRPARSSAVPKGSPNLAPEDRNAPTAPINTSGMAETLAISQGAVAIVEPPQGGFSLPPEQQPYISFITALPEDEEEEATALFIPETAAADSGSPPQETVPAPTYDPSRRSTRSFLTRFGLERRNRRRLGFKIKNRRAFMITGFFALIAVGLLIFGLYYLSRYINAPSPERFVVYYSKLGEGNSYGSTADGLKISKTLADDFRLRSGVPQGEVRTSDEILRINDKEPDKIAPEMKRTDSDVAVWGYYDPNTKLLHLSLTLQPNGPFDIPGGMGYKEIQRRLYDPGLVAFLTPTPPDNATTRQPLSILLSGLYNYYEGGYEQAVAEFNTLIRSSDAANQPALLLMRGNAFFAFGKYKEAVDEYDKLLAIINNSIQNKVTPPIELAYVLNNRAVAVSQLPGKYDEAKANLETALSQEDSIKQRTGVGLSRVRVNYVALQMDRPGVSFKPQELTANLKLLDDATKIEPGLSSAYYYMGRIYSLQSEVDKAADSYKKAQDRDSNQTGIYRELGNVYIETGRDDLVEPARQEFQQGLNLAQQQTQQSSDQAGRLLSLNQAELARVWQNRAKASENIENDLKYGLARAFFEKGWREGNVVGNPFDKAVRWAQGKKTALEEARDRLLDVVANRPNFADPYLYLGMTLELLGEGDPASQYAKAKQLAKDDPNKLLSFYQALATFYLRQNRPNDALAQYNEYSSRFPNSFAGHLNLARVYVNLGQNDKGLAEAQQTIKLNPASAEANLLAGRAKLGQKQPAEALTYFNQAINLKNDYAEALFYRGNALFALNRFNDANKDYNDALTKGGGANFPEAHYRMGLIYLNQQNDPKKALDEFNKAIQQQPGYAAAYFQVGQIYSRDNATLEEAINAYTETIRWDGSNASAYYLRGLLREAKGRVTEAEPDYRRALELEPGLVNARLHLAQLLTRAGKLPEALQQAQFALNQERSAEAWDTVADIYRLSGDYNRARDAYNEAIKLRANYLDAIYGRAAAYYKLQNLGPGMVDINKVVSLDPKYPGALVLQGQYLTDTGKYDEALKAFEQARQLNDKDANLYTSLGVLYLRRNQGELAFENFNRAIQLDGNQVEAHFWLGSIYNGRNDHDRAIAEYEKTVQLRPDWALAWRYLGEQYLVKGELDTAIAKFNTALQKDDHQIEAFYQRGNAYHAKGLRAQAQQDYDAALKLNDKYAPALLQKAITYEEVGDVANARKYYQLAFTNAQPSEGQIKDEAQRSLARLG